MFVAIVPAYNEEKTIGSVVRDLFGHVDKVVVIDDASQDKTCGNAKEAGAVVLRHKINLGQGAALQTGHDYSLKCGAKHILHFDGDGQFDVNDILPALEKLKLEKADILFGSKFLDNRSSIPWFKKYILKPIGILIDRFFSRIKLSDLHNGFRILNRAALEKIVITQDGMAHATEIPCHVRINNLKYIEYPVGVTYHKYGQSSVGGFRIIKDLLVGRLINRN